MKEEGELLKAVKLLVDNDGVNKNVILIANEKYLQKSLQHQGAKSLEVTSKAFYIKELWCS